MIQKPYIFKVLCNPVLNSCSLLDISVTLSTFLNSYVQPLKILPDILSGDKIALGKLSYHIRNGGALRINQQNID